MRASAAYKKAFERQKKSLKKAADQQQMVEDMLWNALFMAIGGAAGGLIKAKLTTNDAVVDGGKDIVKYLTRTAAAMGKQAVFDSDSEKAKGAPAGKNPLNFFFELSARVKREAAGLSTKIIQAKELAAKAENEGTTVAMAEDPVAILARDPGLKFVRGGFPVDDKLYLERLWAEWLGAFAYSFEEHTQPTDRPGTTKQVGKVEEVSGKLRDALEGDAQYCGASAADWISSYGRPPCRRR